MTDRKQITIVETRPSQSGKTLGVKDQQGQWWTTKLFQFAEMQGQTIDAGVSSSDFNGKTIWWINDFVAAAPPPTYGAQSEPPPGNAGFAASAAVPAPVPPASPQHPPQPQQADKDASIAALSLCKSLEFANSQQALAAYQFLYLAVRDWDHNTPGGNDPRQAQVPAVLEPHDDIPF